MAPGTAAAKSGTMDAETVVLAAFVHERQAKTNCSTLAIPMEISELAYGTFTKLVTTICFSVADFVNKDSVREGQKSCAIWLLLFKKSLYFVSVFSSFPILLWITFFPFKLTSISGKTVLIVHPYCV